VLKTNGVKYTYPDHDHHHNDEEIVLIMARWLYLLPLCLVLLVEIFGVPNRVLTPKDN
jgi:hypothetical protein